ncbi:unnamed protein product [Paramecium primaurelia]|uniref:Uncharacterized protein n=1 Tax=Paramecium primaurelia TaxID=5886 RepID=A0A8S1NF00_PARPR|nr:unnamed protein product [Paramecium primaurelia]
MQDLIYFIFPKLSINFRQRLSPLKGNCKQPRYRNEFQLIQTSLNEKKNKKKTSHPTPHLLEGRNFFTPWPYHSAKVKNSYFLGTLNCFNNNNFLIKVKYFDILLICLVRISQFVYGVRTGQLKQKLEGHYDSALTLWFSPDGTTLASDSQEQSILLWDLRTEKQIQPSNKSQKILLINFKQPFLKTFLIQIVVFFIQFALILQFFLYSNIQYFKHVELQSFKQNLQIIQLYYAKLIERNYN